MSTETPRGEKPLHYAYHPTADAEIARLQSELQAAQARVAELNGELTTAYLCGYHRRDDEVKGLRDKLAGLEALLKHGRRPGKSAYGYLLRIAELEADKRAVLKIAKEMREALKEFGEDAPLNWGKYEAALESSKALDEVSI